MSIGTGPERPEALQPDLAAPEQNLREHLVHSFYHLLGPGDGDPQFLGELLRRLERFSLFQINRSVIIKGMQRWVVKTVPEGNQWLFDSKTAADPFCKARVTEHPATELILLFRKDMRPTTGTAA